MKDIQELLTIKRYKHMIIQQRFSSKKNSVAYVTYENKPRVLKWYAPAFKQQMETEYNVLKKGSLKLDIPHPYSIDTKNHVLVMSCIFGNNLCDLINDASVAYKDKTHLITLLSEWFASFHTFFKKEGEFFIRGDAGLRNFIVKNRIWGVDFEEFRRGKPIEDVADMCSSLLTTDPMFHREKFQFCELFIKRWDFRTDI